MTTLIPKFDLKDGGSTPAGAVNRTTFDKLADIISVKDFGAVGNGATDDTAAIQAAIDAVPADGGMVYFPEGVYISGSITIDNDNVVICGTGKAGGSTIKLKDATNANLITINGIRCLVENINLDGNGNGAGGVAGNTSGSCLVMNGTQNETSNCAIYDAATYGIYMVTGGHEKHVQNCKVYNCKDVGVISTVNDTFISNSEIRDNEGSANVVLAGANNRIINCHMWASNQYTTVTTTDNLVVRNDGFEVLGCTFDNARRFGILVQNLTADVNNTGRIIGNWFYSNNLSGTGGSDIRLAGSGTDTIKNVVIANNNFYSSASVSYNISGSGTTYKNVLVLGNTFDDVNPAATSRYSLSYDQNTIIQDDVGMYNQMFSNAKYKVVLSSGGSQDINRDWEIVSANLTTGSCTYTLPAISTCPGKKLDIVYRTGSGTLSIAPFAGDLVNGSASAVALTSGQTLSLFNDGFAGWYSV